MIFLYLNMLSFPTLPEREENDRLDGEELDDRVEGPEELLGGEVEEEQGVECSWDTRNKS